MLNILYIIILYIFLVYNFLIIILSRKNNKDIEKNISKNIELYYYFLVPCVNEELVIEETIKSLLKFNENAKVIGIDDASKDRTLDIMKDIKLYENRLQIIERKLPNAQLGKGEALNQAFSFIISDSKNTNLDLNKVIVGVIDADGKLSKNAEKELNKSFSDKNIDAAQMRVKMFNKFSNSLQVAQDLEFFTINNMAQKARIKVQGVGLSGNGQFFRLGTILENIGDKPWGKALLDDYELTLKLMMKGLKIDYIYDAYVYQEALTSIKGFIRQRSRWVQGSLDCLKYSKDIISSKIISKEQKYSICYFLTQPIINLMAQIILIGFFVKVLKNSNNFHIEFHLKSTVYILGILAISLLWGIVYSIFYIRDLKIYNEPEISLKDKMILPFVVSYIYVLLFFSIIIAFTRKILGHNTWIKTKRNKKE